MYWAGEQETRQRMKNLYGEQTPSFSPLTSLAWFHFRFSASGVNSSCNDGNLVFHCPSRCQTLYTSNGANKSFRPPAIARSGIHYSFAHVGTPTIPATLL
jgi:hypothetical protein